jgi:hypothetical protein
MRESEIMEKLNELFPTCSVGTDNEGQIIIYTNHRLKIVGGSFDTDKSEWVEFDDPFPPLDIDNIEIVDAK